MPDTMTRPMDAPATLTPEEGFRPYRAVSRSAALSFAFAVIGLIMAVFTLLCATIRVGDATTWGVWTAVLSAFAVILGVAGLMTIRRFPTEYTGKLLARLAVALGVMQIAAGIALASYTYATEVPEGYTRISFSELQPDPERPLEPVPARAFELNGKPIFIKGYMHPGVASMGKVNHFVLVFDYGTCCFGGQPKPTHMIEVRLPDSDPGLAYSQRTLKLAGKFELGGGSGRFQKLTDVIYHLNAEQVR